MNKMNFSVCVARETACNGVAERKMAACVHCHAQNLRHNVKKERIFFTENDLSHTVDFFHYGMREMAENGD